MEEPLKDGLIKTHSSDSYVYTVSLMIKSELGFPRATIKIP